MRFEPWREQHPHPHHAITSEQHLSAQDDTGTTTHQPNYSFATRPEGSIDQIRLTGRDAVVK
jgi:hypothetical protein